MINLKKYKSIKGKNAQKQGLELNMHPFEMNMHLFFKP